VEVTQAKNLLQMQSRPVDHVSIHWYGAQYQRHVWLLATPSIVGSHTSTLLPRISDDTTPIDYEPNWRRSPTHPAGPHSLTGAAAPLVCSDTTQSNPAVRVAINCLLGQVPPTAPNLGVGRR